MSRRSRNKKEEQLKDDAQDIEDLTSKFSELSFEGHTAYEKIHDLINKFNKGETELRKFAQWLQTDCFFVTYAVDKFLKTFGALLDRAIKEPNPVYSNGDNFLFTGIKGVGKTTLLKLLFLCTKLILNNYHCYYIDFEERQVLPSKLMGWDPEKHFTALFERPRFFFGDEVHCLYHPIPIENDQNVHIVRELYRLGKSSCPTFISGSSSQTAALVFKHFEKIGLNAEDYLNYPDLNNSVFRDFRLFPIRSEDQFKEFIQKCGNKSGLGINELYFHTGGVLRYMTSTDPMATEVQEQRLQLALQDDNTLLDLFIQLSSPDFDINMPWNLHKVQDDGTIHATVYYKWIESSLIYRNMNSQFEYLFPFHAEFMKKPYSPTNMTNAQWLAAKSIIVKPGGKRAGDVFADYIVEKILVPKILKHDGKDITFNPNPLKAYEQYKKEDFILKFRTFAKEQGIDGLILEEDKSRDFYTCSCFQLKTSGTQYPHPIKCGTNPMSLTNILKKFKEGSGKLYKVLEQVLNLKNNNQFKFMFYLVSTGELSNDQENYLTTNCVDFSNKVVTCKFICVWEHLPPQLQSLRNIPNDEGDESNVPTKQEKFQKSKKKEKRKKVQKEIEEDE